MLATKEKVMAVTPYDDITNQQVQMAQFIIELFVGRSESEVDSARDRARMSEAVIAQTVYMRNNPQISFEQVAASSIGSGDSAIAFKGGDFTSPWIAPLAVIATDHLSWRKARSVHTGRLNQRSRQIPWDRD